MCLIILVQVYIMYSMKLIICCIVCGFRADSGAVSGSNKHSSLTKKKCALVEHANDRCVGVSA